MKLYQQFLSEADSCLNCWLVGNGEKPYYCNKTTCDDEDDDSEPIFGPITGYQHFLFSKYYNGEK